MVELVSLLPGGAAATAVIVVVILFLRQQDKTNVALKDITNTFDRRLKESQKTFQEQVNDLSERQYMGQKEFQSQVQSLMDAHLKLSHETIIAVKALETTVIIIKDKMMLDSTELQAYRSESYEKKQINPPK